MITTPLATPEAIRRAKQYWERRPVFIDTETTGTGSTAMIVEIGIVDSDGKTLLDSLVKPSGKIPADVIAVHGITDEMVVDAPTWKTLWPQVKEILAGRMIGTYNAEFDLRMMKQSHQRYWMDWDLDDRYFFCVMKLYAQFFGDYNSLRGGYRLHRLEAAGKLSGITLPNSHRAADDALLAGALLRYMAEYKK